jgi:hypothetical protein
LSWIAAQGRLYRYLAAVYMIEALSINAGNEIVSFYSTFQTTITNIVVHPSVKLLEATSSALSMFTSAIMRFKRSVLIDLIQYFSEFPRNILVSSTSFKTYAALSFLGGILAFFLIIISKISEI